MREIRTYGSEGGGTGDQPVLPTPISNAVPAKVDSLILAGDESFEALAEKEGAG